MIAEEDGEREVQALCKECELRACYWDFPVAATFDYIEKPSRPMAAISVTC